MKNLFFALLVILFFSCKNDKNEFDVDVSDQDIAAKVNNISDDVYNPSVPFDSLKTRYPFFFDETTPDEVYQKQRTDSLEHLIYSEIKQKINFDSLELGLTELFKHIKYYYPKFESPTVYAFSSVLSDDYKYTPVKYYKDYNTLLIALDYFLGTDNELYKAFKVEKYLRTNMNPINIVPMSSLTIAETMPLMDVNNNQFLNYMVTYGKVYLLQDAFLPDYPDYLKIGYTPEQIDWCYANERNMWDYFIRNDYLYSDDKDLLRRFIYPAPFSKFFITDEDNESVDTDSPGSVGKWLGWQIVRSYKKEEPEQTIPKIMANRNFEQIFKESKFQPK